MNTAHLKGMSVVSIDAGERLGSISEVLLDPAAERVVGFAIDGGGGGMLSGQPAETNWLAASDVHSIGPDAMTVKDGSVLSGGEGGEATLMLSAIMGEKVVTEGGTYVGQVASAEIDEVSMDVRSLDVSPGFFKSNKMVSRDDFITVGDELIIVSDSVVAEPPAPEEETMDAEETPGVVTETYGMRREGANEQ